MTPWQECWQKIDNIDFLECFIVSILLLIVFAYLARDLWQLQTVNQFKKDQKTMNAEMIAEKYFDIIRYHPTIWSRISPFISEEDFDQFPLYFKGLIGSLK
jgi:hypothetical protein